MLEPGRTVDTTAEEDRATFGQRRINLIWEGTQAAIALLLICAFVYSVLNAIDSPALNNMLAIVVGFYFGRTNHQRIGGVIQGR